jgi:hypothetical protein
MSGIQFCKTVSDYRKVIVEMNAYKVKKPYRSRKALKAWAVRAYKDGARWTRSDFKY